ncbi:hypothetical protein E2C01_072935 [Portunus trituberculatus]|uniref:Uncharacterized protein n=1 Tax=Portunus trituberculatus TaxID=210409 RepID=A0A5B7I985_PORTR|nr:hypothetical protein [Portunus trituberculatus]
MNVELKLKAADRMNCKIGINKKKAPDNTWQVSTTFYFYLKRPRRLSTDSPETPRLLCAALRRTKQAIMAILRARSAVPANVMMSKMRRGTLDPLAPPPSPLPLLLLLLALSATPARGIQWKM